MCNVHKKSDPKLANGYYGIGLSQGGLLIRGLAQRCPEVPIKGKGLAYPRLGSEMSGSSNQR